MNTKPHDLDPQACIRVLLDKTQDAGVREDAGDGLMWHPFPESVRALLTVITDQTADPDLREASAESLGSLWSQMEYAESDLASVPEPYRSALLSELELKRNAEQGGGEGRG